MKYVLKIMSTKHRRIEENTIDRDKNPYKHPSNRNHQHV